MQPNRLAMHIKIYFQDIPLYICDDIKKLSSADLHDARIIDTGLISEQSLEQLIEKQKKYPEKTILTGGVFERLKENVFKYFQLIHAAGGIVLNENKALLFIFRKGKWDLPKGKMEEGENPAECAEREITEETGVAQLNYVYAVGNTYHYYQQDNQDILKISHWFHFTTKDNGDVTPQLEEDITEVKWVETKNIKEPMQNTYETIKNILTIFFEQP